MEMGGPSKAARLSAFNEDSGRNASGGACVGIAPVGSDRVNPTSVVLIAERSRLAASS